MKLLSMSSKRKNDIRSKQFCTGHFSQVSTRLALMAPADSYVWDRVPSTTLTSFEETEKASKVSGKVTRSKEEKA